MPAGRNKGGSPKEAVLGGGHGPRRAVAKVTPSGRARNAPRWSTAAALAMDEALQICADREGGGRIAYVRALLCGREPAGFFASVRRLASRRDERLVRDIVSSHRDRLPERPSLSQLDREAKSLVSTMAPYYRGVGQVEELGVQPAPAAAGVPERASLEQVCGRPDLQVGLHRERSGSEQVAKLREWGLLGAKWVPPHTVASMTAVSARVEEWRSGLPEGSRERRPPREVLMKSASDVGAPTAARSSSNHLWWLREGRRLTAGELLCLMGVCTGARLFLALTNPALVKPSAALGAIGDGVHVGVCVAVLRRAAELGAGLKLGSTGKFLTAKGPLRYASSCSGVDLFAQALERMYGVGGWKYVAACEKDASNIRVLLSAYGGDGLREEAVSRDAEDVVEASSIVRDAGGDLDLWVFTPPCRAYSQLNRYRTWDKAKSELERVKAMFLFAHLNKPKVIVLENVPSSESVAAISSVVVGLNTYKWYGQEVSADVHAGASIRRKRYFWVGIKM